MNWEAINAIAQLVSSLGVIVSLWYLAVQVHRSTRIAKLAAQDAATTALREVTRPFRRESRSGTALGQRHRRYRGVDAGREGAFFSHGVSVSQGDGDNPFPLHLRFDGGTGL